MARSLLPLSLLCIVLFSAGPAQAAVAPSRTRRRAGGVRERSLDRVHRVLRERAVAERLGELGMAPAEVERRLERLSDDDLFELSRKLDQLDSAAGHCEEAVARAFAEVLFECLLIALLWPFYLLYWLCCIHCCCS
jgi:hypothetical protein